MPSTDLEKSHPAPASAERNRLDEFKNLYQIEHTRHRSVANFVVNLMTGIIAYCLGDNKPTLSLIKVNLLPQT